MSKLFSAKVISAAGTNADNQSLCLVIKKLPKDLNSYWIGEIDIPVA